MNVYRKQGVYTVVGSFADFEAGTFAFRVLPGYVAGSWDYVCPTHGRLRRRRHEADVVRMAYEAWAAPETRAYDALMFTWSDERPLRATAPSQAAP